MKTKTKVPVPERKWIILILSVILLFVVIFWIKSYKKDSSSSNNGGGKNKQKTESTPTTPQKTLTLTFDTLTPCSPTFDYDFEIKVGGPVSIKFPGVPNLIYWDGKKDIKFPGRRNGPVKIISTNPKNPNVFVKIWKK